MGKNRKQPFGWHMEFGTVVVDAGEASWVRHLYREYTLGTTIRELKDIMENSGLPYEEGRKWNINMIARILSDERYTGKDGYPPIIDCDTFQAAAQKREAKAPAVQKTEVQKVLRKKCGCRVTPHIEHEVTYLMTTVIASPERIAAPNPSSVKSAKVNRLKKELEELMEALPVDEGQARSKVQEIAAAMYESIGSADYETARLKRILSKEVPITELRPELIICTISQVLVDSHGKVKIRLKNEQVIERGEEK